jgi:periplasmic protein TonB
MISREHPDSHHSFLRDCQLWGGSFAVVIALHVGSVWVLHMEREEGESAGDQAVTIELDAVPTAPNEGQAEATPGPQQIQTEQISQASVAQEYVPERTQEEKKETSPLKVDVAQAPDPEVSLPQVPEAPETNQEEQKRTEQETNRQQQQPSEAAPESAPTAAPQAAAVRAPEVTTTAGAPVEDSAVLVSWRARLAAHVERFKRYPAEAMERRMHGTALVRFTINRAGAVIAAHLVGRSGVEALDRESLSLISRAAPLPVAPANVAGTHFTFTVPVRFHPQR